MADFPAQTLGGRQASVITTFNLYGPQFAIASGSINAIGSFAWPTANLAIFVPWNVYAPVTVTLLGFENGGTASGNIDVGIYTSEGNRVVSIGSTAQAGTTAWQTFDITDTTLNPGSYYLAAALDNTTGTGRGASSNNAPFPRCIGLRQAATSFPLPSSVTLAAYTGSKSPEIMATAKTVV